jgi:hypothetical protein
MTKWNIRFLSPEEAAGGGSGDGGDAAAADAAKAAEAAKGGTDGGGVAANEAVAAPVKIKVGDTELSVEDAVKELTAHRQNKASYDALNPVVQAITRKDREAAMKTVEGFFEEPLDPNDIKGRQDRLERQIREQTEMQQAMSILSTLQATHGETFKGDALMKQMMELGIPFDPQNFEKQITMAHKAGQYDGLKADFDTKIKDGIEAGVREALKKGAQLDDAAGVHKGGDAGGDKSESWKGDPVEVAKRKGLKI